MHAPHKTQSTLKESTRLLIAANHRNVLINRHDLNPHSPLLNVVLPAYRSRQERKLLAFQIRCKRNKFGAVYRQLVIANQREIEAGKCTAEVVIALDDRPYEKRRMGGAA